MDSTNEPQVVCLLDILGFENLLRKLGLAEIRKKYDMLIKYVKEQEGGLDVVPTPDGRVAVGWLVLGNAYFSDSLLFWTHYSKMALPSFTHCISEAICHGLEMDLPLRGAIAVGEAVLDKDSGTFLGEPLAEVARTERNQEWIGVSFGPSFAKSGFNDGFHLHTILPYKSHYKDPANEYVTGMAVDWPRRWRESRTHDPLPILERLKKDSPAQFERYYAHTEKFVAFSKEHHDWFRQRPHLDYG